MAPRLFLIDGYALIFRAHHALRDRPLRNARGENTSIPRAVLTFLTRLLAEHHPDAIVWVNDAGDSGRTAEFPAYKANREPMEAVERQEFERGVERVDQLLAAFRIPLLTAEGWEADDVIGTLAAQAGKAGWDAVIVSGDKDLYQLIGPAVSVLNPGRGGATAVDPIWVDESNAQERLGVPPRQVVDYLALVGDSADNIPGVRGIGEKGAVELLGKYGDLETLLAHADEVTQKRYREGLQQHAAEARLSRRLATIRLDAPVTLDLDRFQARPADPEALARVYAELSSPPSSSSSAPPRLPGRRPRRPKPPRPRAPRP